MKQGKLSRHVCCLLTERVSFALRDSLPASYYLLNYHVFVIIAAIMMSRQFINCYKTIPSIDSMLKLIVYYFPKIIFHVDRFGKIAFLEISAMIV